MTERPRQTGDGAPGNPPISEPEVRGVVDPASGTAALTNAARFSKAMISFHEYASLRLFDGPRGKLLAYHLWKFQPRRRK
jgi:hypothetical protein